MRRRPGSRSRSWTAPWSGPAGWPRTGRSSPASTTATGMNLQVLAGPAGQLLWVSGALPGSAHDMKAAWIWGIEREMGAAGLPALADKGYQGAVHARTPYRGKGKPESRKEANRAHAKLRAPGERANAQLKAWKILARYAAALARRADRQGHPRFASSRDQSKMKKAH